MHADSNHPPLPRQFGWTGTLLVVLAVLLVYCGTSQLTGVTKTRQHAYFDHLAVAFLDGKLYLENPPGQSDLTLHDGYWYVPFPPLVAGLMLPWIAVFGFASLNSIWFSTIFGALNVGLLARILDELARRRWITLSVGGRVWLLTLFAFGYLHWQVAIEGSVWFLSHTCTVTFFALATWLALKCERPWLPALVLALAIWGRPTVLFAWPLLAGIAAQKLLDRQNAKRNADPPQDPSRKREAPAEPPSVTTDSTISQTSSAIPSPQHGNRTLDNQMLRAFLSPTMLRWAVLSVIPLLVSIAGMAWYNYARFQNIFDFGYANQKVSAEVLTDLARGQFHLSHLPRNLYIMIFGPPRWYEPENHPDWRLPIPNDKGMSLLLTTPAFLFVLSAWPRRDKSRPQNAADVKTPPDVLIRAAWLAIGLTLVPLLLYYNTGWRQFGYRFSLDFIIPLMILLAVAFGTRTTRLQRTLILVGILINAWGVIWWYTSWLD